MTKTQNVRARCTVAEYEALTALAESEARNPSEMLRELIRTAAQQRGLWPLPQVAGLPGRVRDLRKGGQGVNQIRQE